MTPMKRIILFGVMILVEDMAGGIELKATCPNERDAAWLAGSLKAFHKVPLDVLSGTEATVALAVLVARR